MRVSACRESRWKIRSEVVRNKVGKLQKENRQSTKIWNSCVREGESLEHHKLQMFSLHPSSTFLSSKKVSVRTVYTRSYSSGEKRKHPILLATFSLQHPTSTLHQYQIPCLLKEFLNFDINVLT